MLVQSYAGSPKSLGANMHFCVAVSAYDFCRDVGYLWLKLTPYKV